MKRFFIFLSTLLAMQFGFAEEAEKSADIQYFNGFEGVQMDDPALSTLLDNLGANFVDRHGPGRGRGPGRPGPRRPGPDRWPRPDRHRPPVPGPWQQWTCYFENARRMVFVGQDFNYNRAYDEAHYSCQRVSRWCYFINCRR